MKFCRDCTHCIPGAPIKCGHPTALVRTDIVTGERTYNSAWYARTDGGPCGVEAQNFKPHGPVTRFFISLLGIHDA